MKKLLRILKALAVDPNHVGALNNKGNTLYSLERYNEAIVYYNKSLAIDPNDFDALYNIGLSLSRLEKYNEAITYFDKALAIDPNYDLARKFKSLAIERLG
jgi:tetratricopeptide (TPR) repeat protein